MISYDRSSGKSMFIWGGAILLVVVGGALWWSQARQGGQDPEAAASASAAGVAMRGFPGGVSPLSEPPQVLSDGRPSDFSQDDWQALQETVGQGPNGQAELKRVTAYLRFQRGFEQWQAMQESTTAQERKGLAEQLLQAVPERLQQSEVTVGEALMIATALYGDLEPDEAARSVKLDQFRIKLEAVAPRVDNAAEMREANCLAEYKRREAIIQQDYLSRPDPDRDQKKFEADLDAAHRAVYDGTDCGR
ncbi:MAG TPA: hypothetical protein PLS22_05170 [Aquabacterium sp.]|nr:hypothetical protein [Aquabacterium sp.]